MPLLSYRYETGINGVVPTPLKAIRTEKEFKKAEEVLKKGADTKMQVKARFALNRAVPLRIERSLSESIPVNAEAFSRVVSNDKTERAILLIQGLSEPPKNSIFIRVFINKEDANQSTPTSDVHYAGSFYFFTHDQAEMKMSEMKTDLMVDITDTLKRLSGEIANMKNVKINLVTVPIKAEAGQNVTIFAEDLQVIISPVTVKLMNIH